MATQTKIFSMHLLLVLSFSTPVIQAKSLWVDTTKDIHILTIGNSFANNACKYLGEIVTSVPGRGIRITKANIGGCSLEKHASLIAACENDRSLKPYGDKYSLKEILARNTYDFVTIQQVSSQSFKAESYEPHAQILIELIRKYAPDAEILVHQTWAYSPSATRLKDWNLARQIMHDSLTQNYDRLAERYGLGVLRSGASFFRAYKKNDRHNLWSADGYHASAKGCYLAGCVWYAQLFGESPNQVNFKPLELTNKEARFLRRMANKEYKHSTSRSGV